MQRLDTFALFLTGLSAISWGIVAFFGLNPVDWLQNNPVSAVLNRITFCVIAIAGLWSIRSLFRGREEADDRRR